MKKLFWENPYLFENDANVTNVDSNAVYLDQSVFFAFSGGQASDEGTINGIKVIEAIKEDDKIRYVLEANTLKVGDNVHVSIDKERRLKLMRLHSAAHIVHYVLYPNLNNATIIGSNVSIDKARLDYGFPEPISKFLPEIQEKVNKFIANEHDIVCNNDPQEPEKRHWLCADWDMLCGGTHVKNTREIGNIKLKRKNIGAGKERVEITLVD